MTARMKARRLAEFEEMARTAPASAMYSLLEEFEQPVSDDWDLNELVEATQAFLETQWAGYDLDSPLSRSSARGRRGRGKP